MDRNMLSFFCVGACSYRKTGIHFSGTCINAARALRVLLKRLAAQASSARTARFSLESKRGLPYEWIHGGTLARTTLDSPGRWISASADCRVQTARGDTLVPLRRPLHPGGVAAARAADAPRTPRAPARSASQTVPARGAPGGGAQSAGGKQCAVIPELDRGSHTQIARWSRPAPLRL